MTRFNVRRAGRVLRAAWLGALVVGALAEHLPAQGVTGKIEGRVRDQAGAPVASAQVIVVGTAFAATANVQGYWFINNIPAGTVALKAQFVGYKPVEVTGLKVLAGQTITQDFALEQTPLDIGEVTVTVAANALVPRDEVTSKQRVDGDFTAKLPVDRIQNVLALQPGVVASGNGNFLSIRGGRIDENAVYVDGVPVSSAFRGNNFAGVGAGNSAPTAANPSAINVPSNGFEQADITTGSSSAEFGNAQSGIVSIATRSGGARYSGSLGYESDEPFGVNHSIGFNRVQGSLGGPITKALTFFLSGVLDGQRSAVPGMHADQAPMFVPAGVDTTVAVPSANGPTADTTFVDVPNYAMYRGNCDQFASSRNPGIAGNYGVKCQGIRTPFTATSTYQASGKLTYTYGVGSRIALTATQSRTQGRFDPLAGNVFPNFYYSHINNPVGFNGQSVRNRNLILNWTQNLSKSTERALALETYLSYQQDRIIEGPLQPQSELDSRDPFGGFLIKPLKFRWDFDNFPVNQELIDNFRNNRPGTRRTPYDLENPTQYTAQAQYRLNPYGVFGNTKYYTFFTSGGPGNPTESALNLYRESRYIGKANLDWQFDRYNRLKLGGEYTKYDMVSYASALINLSFSDAFLIKPVRYNGFLEDRLDLGDVVVQGGLRYDFFDAKSTLPYLLDTLSTISGVANPTFGQYNYFPRISTWGYGDSVTINGQRLPLVALRPVKSHDYLSPHIQVAFPVTNTTNFRLSYAHQVQAPDPAIVAGGSNTDLQTTNTNQVYGQDLDFGKTITFEFGVRHSFSQDMVLDVAAYNKDKLSDPAGRLISLYDPVKKQANDIRLMTNADFGNTRGIDVRFDRRIGQLFNGVVSYTYQQAKNTGTSPYTYINFGSRVLTGINGSKAPPAQAILPTATNRPHNVAGAFSVSFPSDWHKGTTFGSILRGVSVFTTFRYASGTGYTSCPDKTGNEDVLSGSTCSKDNSGDVNASRLPAFKQLDLKLSKGFGIRGVEVTAFMDARNILNLQNVFAVFAVTQDVSSSASRQRNFAADSADFAKEAVANGVYGVPGDPTAIDLSFGGASNPTASCGGWVDQGGSPSAPNCVDLIRVEERYGNGDHVYTLAEQRSASNALYDVARGLATLTGAPRLIRLGFELNF